MKALVDTTKKNEENAKIAANEKVLEKNVAAAEATLNSKLRHCMVRHLS